MRDPLDRKASDLLPAKRGRPCNNAAVGPMTDAERAREYRRRRASRAKEAGWAARAGEKGYLRECSDLEVIDAIRAERAFLDNLVNGPQRGKGAGPSRKRLGALVAELARRYPVA